MNAMSEPRMLQQPSLTDQEVTLADLLVVLGREKRILLGVTTIGTIASLVVAMVIPRDYSASTLLMPPQQQQSNAMGMLAQLGALGGMASAAAGLKTPEELYVSLLQTRSLQDALIKRLKLQERYEVTSLEETRKILANKVDISVNKKSGLISVSADDKDAVFAAQLANAHADELQSLLGRLAVTDAQQRRLFFETQVTKTQKRLTDAEMEFRKTQAESGLVVTQALAESGVREGIQLRAQIAAREVQLQTLSQFATSQHSDVQRITAELSALRKQLNQIERGRGRNSGSNSDGIKAVQSFREMKIQEALLEALVKQLELARADEAKDGPQLQQIDPAMPPERPTKPKRSGLVVIGMAASLLISLLWILIRQGRKTNSLEWARIKQAWL